jgi:micrococcal nuclease
MSRLVPLLLVGCYTPPDVETTPFETPILTNETVGACASQRGERVACVIDGDTFDAFECGTDNRTDTIRLLGIDAPETEKPGSEAQCFADTAFAELARITEGRFVQLTFDSECQGVFGRTLAYVWMEAQELEPLIDARLFEDLTDSSTFDEDDDRPLMLINEYLLLGGFARLFDEAWVDPLRWQPELVEATTIAQNRRSGLWGICE